MSPIEIDKANPPIIRFAGRDLPPAAFFLDVAASIPEADEELSVWWWRFCICVGRTRRADSKEVIGNAQSLKSLIEQRPRSLYEKVRRGLSSWEPDYLLSQWIRALNIIIQEATTRPHCEWGVGTAANQPGDSSVP